MKELTPDLHFLFRRGMELTEEHVMEIFDTDELHLKYPDLIIKTHHTNPRFIGSDYLHYYLMPKPTEYDVERFIEKAPDIYNNGYKANERPYAALLEVLDPVDGKSQIYHGLMSGILKYNRARSYYFDKEGLAILEQYTEENAKWQYKNRHEN